MKASFWFCLRAFFTALILFLFIPVQDAFSATYEWTQATRWREDAPLNTRTRKKYPQQLFPFKGYDVRPHEQLWYMFPFSISGFGNNKETSDNLWVEIYNSSRVIGNSSNLTRAKDIIEDFHINFTSPFSFTRNYYFHFYTDHASSYVNRSSFPLYVSGGPHNGEYILNNNNLIAVGDDNTLWFDSDGTFSVYNYPTGTLEFDSTVTQLNGGPSGWAGASLASKLPQFIGYEQSNYYFLEGDNTLIVYNRYMNHVRTDEVLLDGELWGYSLADLVDGNITNALYLGWDLGPVVAFVYPDYGGNPPVAANTYEWTHTARWLEDARIDSGPVIYQQEVDGLWDSRPHQQLRTMFPGDIVGDGNNQQTSDNLWASILTSEHLIGNSGAPVKAIDAMEDFHYNFIDPAVTDRSYYFYFYHDNDSLWLSRSAFPTTLANGPNAGESLINNPRLLAMGDDNSLWLDNDGTLSYYNYPGGTLEYDSSVAAFPQGPPGWIGVPVVENLDKLIGYEQALLYFLEGESTVHVFLYSTLSYIRTDVVELDGDLAGHTLREIIDHEVPGVTYGGWDLGPVFIMVDTAPATAVVDHFRFSYNASALTCNPHNVQVTACADASCSTLYTDPVEVTLSPSGWVGGDTFTVTGGTATRSLSVTTSGTVNIGVTSSSPARAGGSDQCSINGSPYSTDCSLTFADAGLLVSVPDFLSSKGTSATISAVRKSDDSLQCVAAFGNTVKPVQLWAGYEEPAAGTLPLMVDGTPVSASSSLPTLLNLSFDANGTVTIPLVDYEDAGRLSLNATYSGSGADLGLNLIGSDSFVVRPAGLCVSTGVQCGPPYTNCGTTKVAGENFKLSITAVAWESDTDTDFCSGNTATPNYSATGLTLSSQVISPVGGQQGVVQPFSYDHVAALNGLKEIDASQSEVGVFRVGVTPPVYLGAALGSTNSLSPVTYFSNSSPRFTPHHFDASVVNPGRWQPSAPSGNTYVGEPLFWAEQPVILVSARNSSGAVTRNYTEDGYLKLTSADVLAGMTAPLADRTNLGRGGSPLALSADSNFVEGELATAGSGVMQYTFSVLDQLVYARNAQSEVAPYNPDIEIVFDNLVTPMSDGEADLANRLSVLPVGSSVDMRFGRMRLLDSFGPETENLTIPLVIEFYDGASYEVNTVDNDSVWDNGNASVDTLSSIVAGGGTFTGGQSGSGGISLLAPTLVPGVPDTGTATITYDAPSWLEGDFDNDGVFDNDPSATATFGVYRGHERVIFRREVR